MPRRFFESPDGDTPTPRIVVIDHHDSFVHNLARYVRLADAQTVVVRADAFRVADIIAERYDGVILSPGPHGPADIPETLRLLDHRDLPPTLGVCLGHQAIAHHAGMRVAAVGPMHGSASNIVHDRRGLFAGCPDVMPVARYHSLAAIDWAEHESPATNGTASRWTITARTECGIVMGLRHRDRPIFGVQFHPESILTPDGFSIIENFVDVCRPVVWPPIERLFRGVDVAKYADVGLAKCDRILSTRSLSTSDGIDAIAQPNRIADSAAENLV